MSAGAGLDRRQFVRSAIAAALAAGSCPRRAVARQAIGLAQVEGFMEAPAIRVVGNWGSSDPERLARMAARAASVLFRGLSDEEAASLPVVIELFPTRGAPFAALQSPSPLVTRLGLSAIDRRWAQFLYQLGHELGHVLCNFKMVDYTANPFQWFEEALCGACEIVTLERVAEAWIYDDGRWGGDYDDSIRSYATSVRRRYGGFASERALAAWRRGRDEQLSHLRGLRRLNRRLSPWLADRLLEQPERIGSLRYLNLWPVLDSGDFPTHLARWRDACPTDRREFPERIARGAGISLRG